MEEDNIYISCYLTLKEIELVRRLCTIGLQSDKFKKQEKVDIESMLENSLV